MMLFLNLGDFMVLLNGGSGEGLEFLIDFNYDDSFNKEKRDEWNELLEEKYSGKLEHLGGGDSEYVCKMGDRYLKETIISFFNEENPTLKAIQEINFIYRYAVYISPEATELHKLFIEKITTAY